MHKVRRQPEEWISQFFTGDLDLLFDESKLDVWDGGTHVKFLIEGIAAD